MKICQRKFLVGTVKIVIILPPSGEQRIDSEQRGKRIDDRNASARSYIYRPGSKALFDRPLGRPHKRTFQRKDESRCTMRRHEVHLNSGWAKIIEHLLQCRLNLFRVLSRYQPTAEFDTRTRWQHRFGTCSLVSAPQTMDVECRSTPAPIF